LTTNSENVLLISSLLLGYVEYIVIRAVFLKFSNIKLDLVPDRYHNDPKRTWTNVAVLLSCFLTTLVILYLIL